MQINHSIFLKPPNIQYSDFLIFQKIPVRFLINRFLINQNECKRKMVKRQIFEKAANLRAFIIYLRTLTVAATNGWGHFRETHFLPNPIPTAAASTDTTSLAKVWQQIMVDRVWQPQKGLTIIPDPWVANLLWGSKEFTAMRVLLLIEVQNGVTRNFTFSNEPSVMNVQ